jgi:mannose-6-phosphate isomerase-like protein (cupin superfamily)
VKISRAHCEIGESDGSDGGCSRKLLLPGEIKGVETFYVEFINGVGHGYIPEDKKLRLLLFLGGVGSIVQENLSIEVNEPCIFVSGLGSEFSVSGGKKNLLALEIVMSLTAQDTLELNGREGHFPYHAAYSKCKKYDESIKSKKTISRMILPEDIVPRVCIGSVETTGPDQVAAHTHPMLEQLFLGLPGNDVRVMADSYETSFSENDLLHIPLGSNHGVKVEDGKKLHYIWVDLFTHKSEMDYMKENHIILDD